MIRSGTSRNAGKFARDFKVLQGAQETTSPGTGTDAFEKEDGVGAQSAQVHGACDRARSAPYLIKVETT